MDKRLAINAGLMTELSAESTGFLKLQADYFVAPGLNIVLNTFIEPGSEGNGGFALGKALFFPK